MKFTVEATPEEMSQMIGEVVKLSGQLRLPSPGGASQNFINSFTQPQLPSRPQPPLLKSADPAMPAIATPNLSGPQPARFQSAIVPAHNAVHNAVHNAIDVESALAELHVPSQDPVDMFDGCSDLVPSTIKSGYTSSRLQLSFKDKLRLVTATAISKLEQTPLWVGGVCLGFGLTVSLGWYSYKYAPSIESFFQKEEAVETQPEESPSPPGPDSPIGVPADPPDSNLPPEEKQELPPAPELAPVNPINTELPPYPLPVVPPG